MTTTEEDPDVNDEQHEPGSFPGDGVQDTSASESPGEQPEELRGGELDGGGEDPDVIHGEIDDGEESRTGQFIQVSHRGPLPAPETLGGYGRVDPTFPERIVRMAELEIETRTSIAKKLSNADAFATNIGMLGFLILTTLGLTAAFVGMMMDKPQSLGFLALPVLAGLPKLISAVKGNSMSNGDS